MKKTNRFIAMATGFALAAGMAGGIQADAAWGHVSDIVEEGYEQFDDHGLLKGIAWTGKEYTPYLVIRDKETHSKLKAFTYPMYNNLVIFTDFSGENNRVFDEIYRRYEEKLDFNKLEEFDSELVENRHVMIFWDEYDFNTDAIPDKTDIIKEFIDELHAKSLLESASFTPASFTFQDGYMNYDSGLFVECSDVSAEELYETVSKVDADLEVTAAKNDEMVFAIQVKQVKGFKSNDDYIDAAVTVQEAYPLANVYIDASFDENINTLSKKFNLLDPYICDIDGSGNADVSDASAVLKAYAENAAGIQKASEETNLDVNGDGEVNIEDASYILKYYAESAAGLR